MGRFENWRFMIKETIENHLISLTPFNEHHIIVFNLDELMQFCDELEANIKESQQQNEMLLQQVLRESLGPR
jgi:type I restriction enzyme S subunit